MLPSLRERIKLEYQKNKSLADLHGIIQNAVEILSLEPVSYHVYNTKITLKVDQWEGVDPLERPAIQFINRVGFYDRLNLRTLLTGVGTIPDSLETIISSLNRQGYDFTEDDLILTNDVLNAKENSLGYIGSITLEEIGEYVPPVVIPPYVPPQVLSISSDVKVEGSTLVHEIVLNKILTQSTGVIVAVTYNGSATLGVDTGFVEYNVGLGWVTTGVSSGSFGVAVPIGSDRFSVRLLTKDDIYYEGEETYQISAKIGNQTPVIATGTIIDNDPVPVINITDASTVEGDLMTHTVSLSTAWEQASSYGISLVGETATATLDFNSNLAQAIFTQGVYFNPANNSIVIPPKVVNFTISYATVDDQITESTETVRLTIGNKTAIGTILDNEVLPTISVANVTVTEGVDQYAVFDIRLNNPSSLDVQFNAAISNGTAILGQDFNLLQFQQGTNWVSASGATIVIPAGQVLAKLRVAIVDDLIYEVAETFNLIVTVVNNTTGNETATGLGTIISNDASPTVIYLGMDQRTEGEKLLHTVNLSNPSSSPTIVGFTMTSEEMNLATNISNVEYSFNSLNWFAATVNNFNWNVTVPAGIVNFNVRVTTIDNIIDEADTRKYIISAGVGNQVPKTAEGIINDNDITQNPGTGTPEDPVIIQDFDFAVLRYIWTAEAGRDLDTRTYLNTPDRLYGVVGWAKSQNDGSILSWGGDNTQSGVECVLISTDGMKLTYPDQQEFEIFANAFWYSQILTGDISIQFESYKGGTMTKNGYDWVNTGGQLKQSVTIAANVQNVIGQARDMGIRAATLKFNVVTKTGTLNSVAA